MLYQVPWKYTLYLFNFRVVDATPTLPSLPACQPDEVLFKIEKEYAVDDHKMVDLSNVQQEKEVMVTTQK